MAGRDRLRNIRSYENRLDNLFALGDGLGAHDDYRVQSYFARLLAIMSSGYVEKSVQTILYEYSLERSNPRISQFVEETIKWENSLNCSKVESILNKFDDHWYKDISSLCSPEVLGAVDSLKNLRDIYAHGGDNGTGFATIKNYYSSAKRFVQAIETVIIK